MNCKKTRKNISVYLDGKLTGQDLAGLEQHLSQCKVCAQILAETKKSVETVSSSAQQPLPDGFYDRLSKNLDQADKLEAPQPFINWNYFVRGAASVAAIVLVFIIVKESSRKTIIFRSTDSPALTEKNAEVLIYGEEDKITDKVIMSEPGIKNNTGQAAETVKPPMVEQLTRISKEAAANEEIINYPEKKESSRASIVKNRTWSETQLKSKMELADGGFANVPTAKRGEKSLKKEQLNQDSGKPKQEVGADAYKDRQDLGCGKSEDECLKLSSADEKGRKEAKKMKSAEPLVDRRIEPKHSFLEWQGQYSGYTDRNLRVIKDLNTWKTFWQEHTKFEQPTTDLPAINFNQQMVVAVFIGQQNTGGYSIEIIGIEKQKDKIIVKYKETIPSPDHDEFPVLTQPYHIKVIEKINLPVLFKKEKF